MLEGGKFVEEEKVNTEAENNPLLEQLEELVNVLSEEQKALDLEKKANEEKAKEEELLIQRQEEEQIMLEEKLEQEEEGQKELEMQFREQVLQMLSNENADSNIDYTEQLNAIVESVNFIKENQNYVSQSDHVINLYGLILFPLVITIYGLWKMMKWWL